MITGAALVEMPLMAISKRRTGRALDNRPLIADAAWSAFSAFTSGAALGARGKVSDVVGRPAQQMAKAWTTRSRVNVFRAYWLRERVDARRVEARRHGGRLRGAWAGQPAVDLGAHSFAVSRRVVERA